MYHRIKRLHCLPDGADVITPECERVVLGHQGEAGTKRIVFLLPDGVDNIASAKIVFAPAGHDRVEVEAAAFAHAVDWTVPEAFTRHAGTGELDIIIDCADGSRCIPYAIPAVVARSLGGSGTD